MQGSDQGLLESSPSCINGTLQAVLRNARMAVRAITRGSCAPALSSVDAGPIHKVRGLLGRDFWNAPAAHVRGHT